VAYENWNNVVNIPTGRVNLRRVGVDDNWKQREADGTMPRLDGVTVQVDTTHATAGFTVRTDGPGGQIYTDYWLSLRQNDDGSLSVRAWRELPTAPAGEEIVVENPNPGWFQ
jgi:hypothetical protein